MELTVANSNRFRNQLRSNKIQNFEDCGEYVWLPVQRWTCLQATRLRCYLKLSLTSQPKLCLHQLHFSAFTYWCVRHIHCTPQYNDQAGMCVGWCHWNFSQT